MFEKGTKERKKALLRLDDKSLVWHSQKVESCSMHRK